MNNWNIPFPMKTDGNLLEYNGLMAHLHGSSLDLVKRHKQDGILHISQLP